MKVEVIVKMDGEEKVFAGSHAFGFVGDDKKGEDGKFHLNNFAGAEIEKSEDEARILGELANFIIGTIEGVIEAGAPEGCEEIGKEMTVYNLEQAIEEKLIPEQEREKYAKIRSERKKALLMKSIDEYFKAKN